MDDGITEKLDFVPFYMLFGEIERANLTEEDVKKYNQIMSTYDMYTLQDLQQSKTESEMSSSNII